LIDFKSGDLNLSTVLSFPKKIIDFMSVAIKAVSFQAEVRIDKFPPILDLHLSLTEANAILVITINLSALDELVKVHTLLKN
jgi:hypothetical protein